MATRSGLAPANQNAPGDSSVYDNQKVAQAYRMRNQSVARLYFTRLETGLLEDLPLAGRSALDVGTGVGQKALVLSARCRWVVAGDRSRTMLSSARAECRTAAKIVLACFDAARLPFHAQTFDLLTSYGLLESTRDLMPFIREFRRVLNPAGYLVFTCPNAAAWRKAQANSVSKQAQDGRYVKQLLAEAGFYLQTHRTIFFLPELCLWRPLKVRNPTALDWRIVGALIRIETALSQSARWCNRGRTHLFIAQRPPHG